MRREACRYIELRENIRQARAGHPNVQRVSGIAHIEHRQTRLVIDIFRLQFCGQLIERVRSYLAIDGGETKIILIAGNKPNRFFVEDTSLGRANDILNEASVCCIVTPTVEINGIPYLSSSQVYLLRIGIGGFQREIALEESAAIRFKPMSKTGKRRLATFRIALTVADALWP